jgi:dipeptidyl-peptidase 4
MDENVPPHQALRLVNALTLANKPYDLIYLPNRTHHSGATDGYTIKRTWDYFVQYLHGTPPVRNFKVEVRAGLPDS